MPRAQRFFEVGLSDFVCDGRTTVDKRATAVPEQPPFEDCTTVEKKICTKAKVYHFCANGNFVP
jgi:hypothetical protein